VSAGYRLHRTLVARIDDRYGDYAQLLRFQAAASCRLLKVAESEPKRIRIEDGDKRVLHAIWSRSGKLRVHVASTAKPSESAAEVVMNLRADDVERLERFLRDGP
jgi:hypothetical protein